MRLATVSVLLLAAAPLMAQTSKRPPQATQLPTGVQAPGGVRTQGDWKIRYDRPMTPESALTINPVSNGQFHITTTGRGSAIVWRPSQTASGNFRVEAETELFPSGGHEEGYGLIVGGNNLESDNQTYFYFLIRRDGQFLIKHRAGAETHDIRTWSPSEAIVKQEGTANAKNTLAVEASRDSLTFFVNNQRVHAIARPSVDGIVGLRVNHQLNVHLYRLAITRR
jgi:hypothetical protein